MSERERLALGVDAGGSHTRALILSALREMRGEAEGPGANPSVVGREAAANTIRSTVRAALDAALLPGDAIDCAGIGVAGAAAAHSADWLRALLAPLVPRATIVSSSDYEIAFVGALGERRGVLVLAGTGSFAYGVNDAGDNALAGAWGYLIDDKGSGYWLGEQTLEAVVRAADGRAPETGLTRRVLEALALDEPRDLVAWLYGRPAPPTREIAALAPLVLEQAQTGDAAAGQIILAARDELVLMVNTVVRRLALEAPPIAFGGGLLSQPNALSEALRASLGLKTFPQALYPPVIGAALLALQRTSV